MMRAWYFAIALAKRWEDIIPYIENGILDTWTHNKTIQKARESYRITPEKKEYLKESIMLHEQILKYCDDSEIRGAALCNLSDAYYRYGDYQKAVEYATKLPNLYKTRETALVHILKDDAQKKEVAKSAIEPLVWLLSYHLTALSETENDSSHKEKIIKILDILFEGNESDFISGIRRKASK